MFEIKQGYRENPQPVYFLDDVTEDRGITFQPDVYTFAEWAADLALLTTIVDVGCGWGNKLAALHHRHPDWTFVGVDYGANIEHCREVYDWGTWVDTDLEDPEWPDDLDALQQSGSLIGAVVICSDVIEHLADPRPMLAWIRAGEPNTVVLSTPERDLQSGVPHKGPPPNLCHIREWNGAELRAFLAGEGFAVRHVGLTRGSDQGTAMATQLVVLT